MALVFRADDHNFSVSLDDLALVAHGLDGRTYFHDDILLISGIEVCSGRSFIQSQHGIATEMRSKVFWDAVPSKTRSGRIFRREHTKTYVTEENRNRDKVLRRKCAQTRENSSASDKERAQAPTGTYTDVRDRGVRARDAVSREKSFPVNQDLLRQVMRPFVRS